jgi:hypothetical protein
MVGLNKYLAPVVGQRRAWVVALVFLLAITCEAEPATVDPTSTVSNSVTPDSPTVTATEPPLPTVTPTELPLPTATGTELPQRTVTATALPLPTNTVTANALVEETTASIPESTPTATSPPEIFDTVAAPSESTPSHHFKTSGEALAAAVELGCTGFNTTTVKGVFYYRACANDELFESLASGVVPELVGTSTPVPIVELPTYGAPPETSPDSTPTADATLPPYHYTTEKEALDGAAELGCSGWQGVKVDGVSYYRACGSTETFDLLASGSGVTLTNNPCTIESDPTARFTEAPTDLSLIRSILSSGTAAGGVIKPHSYLFTNDAANGQGKTRVPIYAVADYVLTSIAYYNEGTASEYLIFFDVTCEISFKYDHVEEIVPKIESVAPAVPSDGSSTARTEPISFKAGELIGYSRGAGGKDPWDFGAYDLTHTNQFANQERYVKGGMSQSLHTVCPYEYFVEPLRSQMLAKIGTYSAFGVNDPTCHTTERDVLGAATGAWFDTQELGYAGAKLSIALREDYGVGITGLGSDIRVVKDAPTWLDPDLLTTSHCYVDGERWVYIEIQESGMQLALVEGSGSCPASLRAGAAIYYR